MAGRKDYAAKKAAAQATEQATEAISNSGERTLTVKGQPIPEHLLHLITYEMTDQGKAEVQQKIRESGLAATPGVGVVEDAWEKRLQQFGDDARTGSEPWEDPDPYKAAIARVPDQAGKAFHLFGSATVDRDGDRGFRVERDANGQLIKVGNMVLGSMSADRAKRREEHYKKLSLDAEQAAGQELNQIEARGVTPLRPGEVLTGNAGWNGDAQPTTIGHIRQQSAGEILTGG